MKKQLFFLFFFIAQLIYSQKIIYSTLPISDVLKENANNVVLNHETEVSIISQKLMRIKEYKVTRVFNKTGLDAIDAYQNYDKSTKIKWLDATIYNTFGKEIKNFKQSDFKDVSVADGFSVFTDNRLLYLDYTPTEYPFTIIYYSEVETQNTAFIPSWNPIDDPYESILKAAYTISYPQSLGFKYKQMNFDGMELVKKEEENKITFSIENLAALKIEDYSPSFRNMIPTVLFGLDKFSLEGVEGTAKSWNDFGIWVYTNLLADTEEISEDTKTRIKNLVGTETDAVKKAKIVYKYVQDKTRYVSVQLGIGGWKPMLAKDVDRLGYGDCKALSNYTRVLLKSVGVDSYYTIIYGDEKKKNLKEDFVSMQGNHVVLALPINDKLCFLECTSQVKPFGFEGDFTDDRYALIVSPNKGEIVRTNELNDKLNSQISKGNYTIDDDGNLTGAIQIKSKGIQYDNIYMIDKKSKEDVDDYYKFHFSWINNLKMSKIKFQNDPEKIEFTEDLQINALSYGNKSGNDMIIPINVFNQSSNIPQRYRNRKNPIEIERGFYDEDEIEINLPQGFTLSAKSENLVIDEKFGTYKIELTIVNSNKLILKRSLLINKGFYEKTEYENFRKFKEQIAKADN